MSRHGVGGGILAHGLPALQQAIAAAGAGLGGTALAAAALVADALVGVVAGALALALVTAGRQLWRLRRAQG